MANKSLKKEEDIFDRECSDESHESEYEVEKIVDDKWDAVKKKRKYKVKWVGYEEPTWEPEENLEHCKEKLLSYSERKKRKFRENSVDDENFIVDDDGSSSNESFGRISATSKSKSVSKAEKKASLSHSSTHSPSPQIKHGARHKNVPPPLKKERSHVSDDQDDSDECPSSVVSSKGSSRASSRTKTIKKNIKSRKRLSTLDEADESRSKKAKQRERKEITNEVNRKKPIVVCKGRISSDDSDIDNCGSDSSDNEKNIKKQKTKQVEIEEAKKKSDNNETLSSDDERGKKIGSLERFERSEEISPSISIKLEESFVDNSANVVDEEKEESEKDEEKDEGMVEMESIERAFAFKAEDVEVDSGDPQFWQQQTENAAVDEEIGASFSAGDERLEQLGTQMEQLPLSPVEHTHLENSKIVLDAERPTETIVAAEKADNNKQQNRESAKTSLQTSAGPSFGYNNVVAIAAAHDDFYERLLNGNFEGWESEPLLSDEDLAKIPMEERDPPDYVPMEPISCDGPIERIQKVRVFKRSDQRNGFERGWKVESILGLSQGDDDACFVKFIGFSTPQKLPYATVRQHALQEYFMYQNWIASRLNPGMRGDYWESKLEDPSSWMTERALAAFKQWKGEQK